MRPRSHAPGVNRSLSVFQSASCAQDDGPLRKTTATGASRAMITNSRGKGTDDHEHRRSTRASTRVNETPPGQMYCSTKSPPTWRVVALRRFHKLIIPIDITSALSWVSS